MLITAITLALALTGSSGLPPSDEALRSYFTSMDAADPSPALAAASPGAAAWRYAEHQSAVNDAYAAVGEPASSAEVILRPQGVQRCLTAPDGEPEFPTTTSTARGMCGWDPIHDPAIARAARRAQFAPYA